MEIIECTEIPEPKKGQKLFYVIEDFINQYPTVYKVTHFEGFVEYFILKEEE